MSIIRFSKGKKNPYFLMHNSTITDKTISLKAKGLLAYLISKPDNWYVSFPDLAACSTDGIKSVRSAIKELISAGYLEKSQFRNDNGQFTYYNYTIYEKPQKTITNKNNIPPDSPFGYAVKGYADKGTLLNTDIVQSTYNNNNSPPADSNFLPDAADEFFSKEELEELKQLLFKLGISNHNKLFSEFHITDIHKYAYWLQSRNFEMKNPTGFFISAIKEKWMDYDLRELEPKPHTPIHHCSECNQEYYFMKGSASEDLCLKCFHSAKKQKG